MFQHCFCFLLQPENGLFVINRRSDFERTFSDESFLGFAVGTHGSCVTSHSLGLATELCGRRPSVLLIEFAERLTFQDDLHFAEAVDVGDKEFAPSGRRFSEP